MTKASTHTNTAPRKKKIMREAAYLFRRKGYAGTTLRELAKRSGIQGGSIYHHFTSKQEILYQIITETMNDLFEVKNVIKEEQDPVEKLRKAIVFHLNLTMTKPDDMHITDAELWCLNKANFDHIVRQRRDYDKIFMQILEEGTNRQLMNIRNIKLTTIAIMQMLTGISYWFKKDGPLTILEIADEYVDFICWGITGKVGKH